jgi:hypothetical protein
MTSTTQKEWFKTLTTDHLLSMRYQTYCTVPAFENSKHIVTDSGNMYDIHKPFLYEELNTRPHRVRARDRRKHK